MVNEIGRGEPSNINPLAPTGHVAPPSYKGKGSGSSDSVGKSGGSSSSGKTTLADSPELQQAMYILWISNDQMSIQPLSTSASDAKNAVSAMVLETKQQTCTNILNSWSKSIHEQVEADRRQEKSAKHIDQLEDNLKAGYEAYLSTLTSRERQNMIEFNTLTGVPIANPTFSEGLDDILSKAKAGAYADETIPFMTGAALTAITGSLAVSAMQTAPITGGVHNIVSQIAPAYSVDLSSLANLYITGGINLAAVQTFSSVPGSTPAKIDFEYAKNYAHQITKLVNGNDFNAMAMAIITHNIEQGVQMDDKYVANVVNKFKIAMLSTALSFLYYMESSFNGKGGGITGQEFQDLVNGKIAVGENDPKAELVTQVRSLLSTQENSGAILASIGSWIDDSGKGLDLTKVSPLFNLLNPDTTIGLPVAA